MSLSQWGAYVCLGCIRKIRYGSLQPDKTKRLYGLYRAYGNLSTTNVRPFRMAVIGSGPAGFYASYRVMQKVGNSIIDMYEQLPVPYGLVRYGVAPDHPEVKNCQDKFEEVALSSRFNFIGNISVGYDLPLTLLKPHYDAILFAYGASHDKKLGIHGEDELRGIYSARAFVGWYNGLPEYSGLDPQLDQGSEAVVIGQGNVALDVARILLSDVDTLRKTDITEHALEALAKSKVKSVKIVGRRGPMQAACTIKEVRELVNLPAVSFEPITPSLLPLDAAKLPRQQKRMIQVLTNASSTPMSSSGKSWGFRFLLSPKSFCPSSSDPSTLGSIEFEHTSFAADVDPFSRTANVITDKNITSALPASIAFRSIGYKSSPLPGFVDLNIPFDSRMGIIPNDLYGRVINPTSGPGPLTAGHVPGMYCAGWVKRGPTGVIASTMEDAFTSADIIARDWEEKVPFINSDTGGSTGLGWDGLKDEIDKRGLRRIDWGSWKAIDAAERKRGAELGKEREKFINIEDMINTLD